MFRENRYGERSSFRNFSIFPAVPPNRRRLLQSRSRDTPSRDGISRDETRARARYLEIRHLQGRAACRLRSDRRREPVTTSRRILRVTFQVNSGDDRRKLGSSCSVRCRLNIVGNATRRRKRNTNISARCSHFSLFSRITFATTTRRVTGKFRRYSRLLVACKFFLFRHLSSSEEQP